MGVPLEFFPDENLVNTNRIEGIILNDIEKYSYHHKPYLLFL